MYMHACNAQTVLDLAKRLVGSGKGDGKTRVVETDDTRNFISTVYEPNSRIKVQNN